MSITNYWPTPIYHTNVQDNAFICELMSSVMEINRRHHPSFADVPRTDTEAIQAEFDELVATKHPLYDRLYQLLDEHCTNFYRDGFGIDDIKKVIRPWGQVYFKNESLPYHNHESVLTGVLYLSVPCAEVHFHDPRTNASRGYPREFDDIGFFDTLKMLPKMGDLVIFPSYLFHSVMTNFSPVPRVVIPFDVFAHD